MLQRHADIHVSPWKLSPEREMELAAIESEPKIPQKHKRMVYDSDDLSFSVNGPDDFEKLLRLMAIPTEHKFEIVTLDDKRKQIRFNDKLLMEINHDEDGRSGMERIETILSLIANELGVELILTHGSKQ